LLKAQARSGAALGKKWQIPAKTPPRPGHLQSAGVSTQSARMLHANLAIDIAGLFSCVIQVQKYSVVFDR
ncbi:MAG: hypothetical protein ABSD11_13665, partial [Methylocella sp.]